MKFSIESLTQILKDNPEAFEAAVDECFQEIISRMDNVTRGRYEAFMWNVDTKNRKVKDPIERVLLKVQAVREFTINVHTNRQ